MLGGMAFREPKKEMNLWLGVLASLHDILNQFERRGRWCGKRGCLGFRWGVGLLGPYTGGFLVGRWIRS